MQALATYVNAGNDCHGLNFKQTANIENCTLDGGTISGNSIKHGYVFSGTLPEFVTVDENGTEQTVFPTILKGTETELDAGTYVAQGMLNFDRLTLNGDVTTNFYNCAGGSITLNIGKGAAIDGKKIVYQEGTGTELFTLENLAENLTSEQLAAAIEVKGTLIKIKSADILDASKYIYVSDYETAVWTILRRNLVATSLSQIRRSKLRMGL